jgi:predicted nucleic acid-binding protein
LIRFVLDASVALAWFVDNPVASYAIQVRKSLSRDARAVVPGLWHLEMANGFAVAERRGILSPTNSTAGIAALEHLLAQVIESGAEFIPMKQLLTTARDFQLSAYDAVYLDTARRAGLPLATLDKRLLAAARRAEVELYS